MKKLLLFGVLFASSSCANHKYSFTEGPLRMQSTASIVATVGKPWNLSVILAGVMPPAGALSKWEVTIEGEDSPFMISGGSFFPTKRVYEHFVTFPESWWREKTTLFTPTHEGQDPISFQNQWNDFLQQTDPEASVTVRLYFYDSLEQKWRVYASTVRTVRVSCPQCPPALTGRYR